MDRVGAGRERLVPEFAVRHETGELEQTWKPRRVVRAAQCSGGQLAGAPLDATGLHASHLPDRVLAAERM